MAKKVLDAKAKAKRQKIYAGVGGVILLAVLAFQVPRTLKMLHPASASSSSSAPAPATPFHQKAVGRNCSARCASPP